VIIVVGDDGWVATSYLGEDIDRGSTTDFTSSNFG